MDFINEEGEKTSDYSLQKGITTKPINLFMTTVWIVLIIGIIVLGFYFGWF